MYLGAFGAPVEGIPSAVFGQEDLFVPLDVSGIPEAPCDGYAMVLKQ